MAQKREGYAPFSIERKAGVQSATVNGTIDVVQEIRPTLTTGFIDEKGDWKGLKSSDESFKIDVTHEAVPNGGTVLSPQATPDYIDMTGFTDLFIAIRPSNGGNVKIDAFNGPGTNSFANLTPIDSVRIQIAGRFDVPASLQTAFYDNAVALTADVWNIYLLQGILAEQKVLQFKITNDSGGESNIEFGYLRVVSN
jgi:hypothetical protein